jgi:parallel beta-helix repeat protein
MIAGSSLTYALTPTQTFSIYGGNYPGAPEFTVWVSDGQYFAKNQLGVIVYSGSDAGTVINNAASTDDVAIKFAAGTYTVKTPLNFQHDGITLTGSGPSSTIIILDDNVNQDLLTVGTPGVRHEELTIRDLRLDGNDAANTGNATTAVLRLNSMYRVTLDNVEIFNGAGNGVLTWGASGFSTFDVLISKCKISYNTLNGVYFAWCTDTFLQQNIIGYNGVDNTAYGVYLGQVASIFIENNHIWGNYHGIYSTGSNQVTIIGNFIEDNIFDGVRLNLSANFTISGNTFYKNLQYAARFTNCTQITYDFDTNTYNTNGGTFLNVDDSSTFTYYRVTVPTAATNQYVATCTYKTPTFAQISCSGGGWIASVWLKNATHAQIYIISHTGAGATSGDGINAYVEFFTQ